MTREENIAFMKDFFEKYYEMEKSEGEVLVAGVNIPEEMVDHDLKEGSDWKVWKLVPSIVTDEDIAALEERLNIKLPECLRAFLTHNLAENGYFPFAWDADSYFIRCIDLTNMPDEEKCPVVQIDHEPFFDIQYDYTEKGKLVPKDEIEPLIEEVTENFYEYLNKVLEGTLDEEFDDEDEDEDEDDWNE